MSDRYDENRESAEQILKILKCKLVRYYPNWIIEYNKEIVDVDDKIMEILADLFKIQWVKEDETI